MWRGVSDGLQRGTSADMKGDLCGEGRWLTEGYVG